MKLLPSILAAAALATAVALPASAQVTPSQCEAFGGTVVGGTCELTAAQAEAAGLTAPAAEATAVPAGAGAGLGGTETVLAGAAAVVLLVVIADDDDSSGTTTTTN